MIGSNLIRTNRPINWLRGRAIRGGKWQCFTLAVRNNAGTFQCAFYDSAFNGLYPPVPDLCDRILYATNEWKNMPLINAGSIGFGNVGAGLYNSSQYLLLNTRPQLRGGQPANVFWARTSFFSANTTRPTPYMYHDTFDIFGSGNFYRPILLQCTDFNQAFPQFIASQMANGTYVYFDIEGYFT